MIIAPTNTPPADPVPPAKPTPPMIAADIPCPSYPVPAVGTPEFTRDANINPDKPMKIPANIKEYSLNLFTLIPDALAASAFPPTAYRFLPNLVFSNTIHNTIVATTITITGIGIIPKYPCPIKLKFSPVSVMTIPPVYSLTAPLADIFIAKVATKGGRLNKETKSPEIPSNTIPQTIAAPIAIVIEPVDTYTGIAIIPEKHINVPAERSILPEIISTASAKATNATTHT